MTRYSEQLWTKLAPACSIENLKLLPKRSSPGSHIDAFPADLSLGTMDPEAQIKTMSRPVSGFCAM
ncbi:hypothetical protein LMTR3_09435 [Bradyrhizobium sp. LMTR 3]|nr:hypothetical protein LMTR3_09435 [Bradyrhizobium sp. LMTR 3]